MKITKNERHITKLMWLNMDIHQVFYDGVRYNRSCEVCNKKPIKKLDHFYCNNCDKEVETIAKRGTI